MQGNINKIIIVKVKFILTFTINDKKHGSSAALVEHNLVKDIHMHLFHVPLDNEPLSMRYSVSEAAADESMLPFIQPITSTFHCKVAFAA